MSSWEWVFAVIAWICFGGFIAWQFCKAAKSMGDDRDE